MIELLTTDKERKDKNMDKSDITGCFNKENLYSFIICICLGFFISLFGWGMPLMAVLVLIVFAVIRYFYLAYNKT